jgi:hypothetical protein
MPASRRKDWSGRRDLNSGPPAPKAGALPGCATPRHEVRSNYRAHRGILAVRFIRPAAASEVRQSRMREGQFADFLATNGGHKAPTTTTVVGPSTGLMIVSHHSQARDNQSAGYRMPKQDAVQPPYQSSLLADSITILDAPNEGIA